MSAENKWTVQTNVRSRRPQPPRVIVDRLRRVEAWRRARLDQLFATLEIDKAKRIRAARLYLEVHVRRQATERGLTER